MKAERKHELQHNELDDLLVKASHFFRENGMVLAILAVVILLGVFTYRLATWGEHSLSSPAGKWNDYFRALSERDADKELEAFLDKKDNLESTEAPVVWARQSLADMKLAQGTKQLFEDRKAADENLAYAEKLYKRVEKEAGRDEELRDRARIGLAKTYEAQGNADEAVKYYAMVAKTSPDSALGKVAINGEKRLSEKGNREFLVWFAQQQPVKKTPPAGGAFNPHGDLPGVPDFSMPPLDSAPPGPDPDRPITRGLKIPGGKEPESKGSAEKSPLDSLPPDDEPTSKKPSDDKPSDDKPE